MSGAGFTGLAPRGIERFEILRSLGEGGHGVVYEALDKQRRQLVALKVLRDASAEGIYRFKQEFRTLSGIRHPNLARLDELFSEGASWFFSMELVDGVTFLQYVRPPPSSPVGTPRAGARPGVLDEARLRSALRQLVEGVRALHAAGKLHRDLKPANVLVTHTGRVVILDFGVSSELSDIEQSMSVRIAGTPSYMAPEQAEGGRTTEASDWYSAGVMLFEALTAQNPFDGPLLESLLRKRTGVRPPSYLAPGIPAELDRLCWDLLAPRPAERPSGEEILERIGAASGQRNSAPARPRKVLVGRDTELAALEQAFRALANAKPVVVRLHGESGVGKSALTGEFSERLAREERVLVLSGRCYERESVPYKAMDGLVDALSQRLRRLAPDEVQELVPADASALCRLFPVLGRVDAFASAPRDPHAAVQDVLILRRRAWTAFADLFQRLCRRGPVVLVLDDLQWGDPESMELLAPLLHGERAMALLLVASYRRREAAGSAFLRLLEQQPQDDVHAVDLRLEPLPAEAARVLASRWFSELEPAQLEQLAQESGGNPFLLEQLSRHAAEGHQSAGRTSLRELIGLQLARLPTEARELLELVTVADGPLRSDWLQGALETDAAREALQGLIGAQLLRETKLREHGAIDTYHDRIRESVRDALSEGQRVTLHQRVAELIEGSSEPDAELLATQLVSARQPRRAAAWAVRAADEALGALAFERATRLYRWVLELDSDNTETRLHCWTGLGESLSGQSKGGAAAAALLEAAQLSPPNALDFRRRAAEQLLRCGQIDRGKEVLKDVLSRVGEQLPETQLGALLSYLWRRLLLRVRGVGHRVRASAELVPAALERIDACWSASVGLSLVDPLRAADFSTRQLLHALAAGEPSRLARALSMEVGYGGLEGGPARRYIEHLTGQAMALASSGGHPHALALAHFFSGVGAWLQGEWRDCRQACEVAEQVLRTRCKGAAWEIASCQVFRLSDCIWMGELAEHRRLLPEYLREARERDDLYAVTTLTLLTYSHVPRLASDDPAGASQLVAEALGAWSQSGFHLQHLWALYANVEIALYRNEAHAARVELESQWKLVQGSQLLRVQSIRSFMQHLRGRVALAVAPAEPGALRAAQRAARQMAAERMGWSSGLAELLRAGIALTGRGPAEAAAALERAEALLAGADMQLYAAAARRRRGEIEGGEAGRALVAAADVWMQGQGVVDAARLSALLVPLPART